MPNNLPGGYVAPESEFNYNLWTANTEIMLCNVPWNSDYRDVWKAESRNALDTYLRSQTGPTYQITNSVYARVGDPIDLELPFNAAYRYNYLRVYNPAQPVNGDTSRAFYYFITEVQHINTNDTRIYVQLDIWQTFGFDITFGNAFIESGHIGVANENRMDNFGRDYLTVPEGLDIGGEYVISDVLSRNIGTARNVTTEYMIAITSSVDLTVDVGTFKDPKQTAADGNLSENLPNGAETYIFKNVEVFKEWLTTFKDKAHALQNILEIRAIPGAYNMPEEPVPGVAGMSRLTAGSIETRQYSMGVNWRAKLNEPGRYRFLDKFKVYPYTVLELTSYTGTPVMLKPESWQDPDATVNEIPHFASQNARVMFSPHQYNAPSESATVVQDASGLVRDSGEFLDVATGLFNFPSFSLFNDGYMLYLAANKNSLAYQHTSADWAQTKTQAGSQLGYDQATAGMNTSANANSIGVNASYDSANISNQTDMMSTGLNALTGIAGGARGGVAGVVGGVMGAATSAGHTAIGINARMQQLGVSAGAANAQNANSLGLAGMVRDTNKGYADYAANGDYQNAIAGINAKVQDARMIQPTSAGQVGGESFLLARYQWGYDLKIKVMSPGAKAIVGDYWLRYGYQVNRFGKIPPSLKCMTNFTYWKLRETYIVSSACPETIKQGIRGIFEKGVTVWDRPQDIGNIDIANNIPLSGVTL